MCCMFCAGYAKEKWADFSCVGRVFFVTGHGSFWGGRGWRRYSHVNIPFYPKFAIFSFLHVKKRFFCNSLGDFLTILFLLLGRFCHLFAFYFSSIDAPHTPFISHIHCPPPQWGWCYGSIPASHTNVPVKYRQWKSLKMRLKNISLSYR